MRYRAADGTQYEAQDASDLVHQMHESSFARRDSDFEFTAEMADRMEKTYGGKVRSFPLEDFVDDLMSIGFLKEGGESKVEKRRG